MKPRPLHLRPPCLWRVPVLAFCALGLTAPAHPARADEDAILLESAVARVTKADYETELARASEPVRAGIETSPQRIARLLTDLIIVKTLAAEARAAGLDREPEVARQMALSAEKTLAQIRLNRLLEESQAAMRDEDFAARAREIYKVEQEKYFEPERVGVSHVLVDLPGRTREEALQRAQHVRELALAGTPFETLAQEYSDDPSAKQNKGDLGLFGRGKMVKAFEDAAFAMQTPGEVSEPVETEFGFHVIRFRERQPARQRPFEEVKAGLVKQLKARRLDDVRAAHIKAIKEDKDMVVNEEAIAALRVHLDTKALTPASVDE
jgi:peptidyl-prolyl cis-trans isomerase C